MHRASKVFRRFEFALDERFVDDHLRGHVRQFASLPRLYLLPHGFEVALHRVNPNRDAINQRERLRVIGKHWRKRAGDNVSKFGSHLRL